jgi:hypothetical protein
VPVIQAGGGQTRGKWPTRESRAWGHYVPRGPPLRGRLSAFMRGLGTGLPLCRLLPLFTVHGTFSPRSPSRAPHWLALALAAVNGRRTATDIGARGRERPAHGDGGMNAETRLSRWPCGQSVHPMLPFVAAFSSRDDIFRGATKPLGAWAEGRRDSRRSGVHAV